MAARWPRRSRVALRDRGSGGGAHVAQHGIAQRSAARTMVVDVDNDAGERQTAVRAYGAGELLQREAAIAGEAELHHAHRG
jgi:hypothetical protein